MESKFNLLHFKILIDCFQPNIPEIKDPKSPNNLGQIKHTYLKQSFVIFTNYNIFQNPKNDCRVENHANNLIWKRKRSFT